MIRQTFSLCLFLLCFAFALNGWGQDSESYLGRQPFESLSKDRPAISVRMTSEIEAAGRYSIPLHAAGAEVGQSIADIGFGDGGITLQLAKAVTATGKVYAREINANYIESLRNKVQADELTNVDIAISEKDNVSLPDDSIDIALLADVFHYVIHQKKTEGFCQSLHKAMKPGGIVVVTYVTSARLFDDKWKENFQGTLDAFTENGFEPGMRYIIEDKKRPAVVMEFRKPQSDK